MDNNAENRYDLHQAVISWVSTVMSQNDIPAYMMEDALNDVLYRVREVSFQEYLHELTNRRDNVNKAEKTASAAQGHEDIPPELMEGMMQVLSGGMPQQSMVSPDTIKPEIPEAGKKALENAKKRSADRDK